ncbi:MAG: hypothetical protein FH753_17165 [Firmicutes bacterium]|nr:hypothetical protein [Bacillota bacterium]
MFKRGDKLFFNIKYFTITVIVIFIALGVGMYIGFMFEAQEIVVSTRHDIISQLESRFTYLNKENEKLEKEVSLLKFSNDNYKKFSNYLLPHIVKDKLSGKNIAILKFSNDFLFNDLYDFLKKAGTNDLSVTTINLDKANEDIILSIIDSIISNNDKKIIDYSNKEIISSYGDYNKEVEHIILSCSYEEIEYNNLKRVLKKINNKCRESLISVICIEKEDSEKTYVSLYKELNISSVDNINSVIGKISLTSILNGEEGNFGIKKSSDSLMPDLP